MALLTAVNFLPKKRCLLPISSFCFRAVSPVWPLVCSELFIKHLKPYCEVCTTGPSSHRHLHIVSALTHLDSQSASVSSLISCPFFLSIFGSTHAELIEVPSIRKPLFFCCFSKKYFSWKRCNPNSNWLKHTREFIGS